MSGEREAKVIALRGFTELPLLYHLCLWDLAGDSGIGAPFLDGQSVTSFVLVHE
jgi:hypothetical protein